MRQHNGFSLLEILVAFGIMAVALTIVLRIFGSGVNTAILSEDYTIAVQIAESLMVRTGVEIPLVAGELSGNENAKYAWAVLIEPLQTPAFALLPQLSNARRTTQSAGDTQENPLKMVTVRVTVSWGDDDERRRQVELKTIKLFVTQDS